MRALEASLLLFVADLLIRRMRFGHWRRWIGRVEGGDGQNTLLMIDMAQVDAVTRAVQRAARGRGYRCLCQAMATQWMLARRGLPSRLMFGVAAQPVSDKARELHAWVQIGARTVMGADPTRSYVPALALAQSARSPR